MLVSGEPLDEGFAHTDRGARAMKNTIGAHFKRSELQKLAGLVDFVDLVKEIHAAVLPSLKSHLSLDTLGNLIEQAYYSSELAEEGR